MGIAGHGWAARIFSAPLHLTYVLSVINDGFTWAGALFG